MSQEAARHTDPLAHLESLQSEMTRLRRELEHNERLSMVGGLAAAVAHEVNNLLTPALAYAKLSQSQPDDRELSRKAVEKTVSGIDAASRVLRAILDFGGSSEGSQNTADIRSVVAAAAECVEWDLRRLCIVLDHDVPEGLVAPIEPLELQQIILNLLINARHALSDCGGCGGNIHVSAHQADDAIKIVVADDGPGVPAEIADRLFDPFVSLTVKEGQSGSGLGLAVCRRLVEAAGGGIEYEPRFGGGASFKVRLPAA